MKPVIIYVSGAPGSGKTTLAQRLSDELYIPHVSSDLVHGGIELTQSDHDRKVAITSAFMPLMTDMTQKHISFVVDQVLQKDTAKTNIIDKLLQNANVIYVHVQASDPIERFIHRIETSTQPDIIRRRALLLERAKHHRENLTNTASALDLGIPTIVVNTDDGYNPTIENILKFIQEQIN